MRHNLKIPVVGVGGDIITRQSPMSHPDIIPASLTNSEPFYINNPHKLICYQNLKQTQQVETQDDVNLSGNIISLLHTFATFVD